MERINNITYTLPTNSEDEIEFYANFSKLFTSLPFYKQDGGKILLNPMYPDKALPSTLFMASQAISWPTIKFTTTGSKDIKLDLFKNDPTASDNAKEFTTLPIKTLLEKLANNVKRVDHTGVNISSTQASKRDFLESITKIGKRTNLFEYPENDEWFFILPTTDNEYSTQISDFKFGREPKFEFVYDIYESVPTIQIDFETDLKRKDVERLLPAPYGISHEEVADYFRSVYIEHPWPNLLIRIDVRFINQSNEAHSPWETGEWLARDGRRLGH